MQLQNSQLIVTLRDDGGIDLLEKASGVRFRQIRSRLRAVAVRREDDGIAFRLEGGEIPLTVRLSLTEDACIVLRFQGEGQFREALAWPPAWESAPGDEMILPVGTGIAFPAETPPEGLPGRLFFYSGTSASMGLYGIRRGEHRLFSAVGDICDAELALPQDESGRMQAQLLHLPSKGEFAYPREVRFLLGGSLAEPLRRYRKWRETQRKIVPLREKCAAFPTLERLFGAPSFWLWDDNAMNRLYGRPLLPDPTQLSAETVADELLHAGVDRLLWNSFDGETPECCAALRRRGFLVGKYDVYRDVIPKPLAGRILPYRRERSVNTADWPGIAAVDENGAFRPAWSLHGTDGRLYEQHSVCDLAALELTRRNVPPDVEKIGYNARFIDVQCASKLQECHAPLHPAARRDSLAAIREQMEFLAGLGLVCGVENGSEAMAGHYHYAEGLMSPAFWRAPESGRRMTTLYRGGEVPESILRHMLNPAFRIPLWQLVWHDCCVNYWYWGDSSNCCPELMERRDLFDLLYGEPPLYSLSKAQWNGLKGAVIGSFRRVSPVVRRLAGAKMTDFEILTPDRLVQRTRFDNGMTVTVNFSDEPYSPASFSLPPHSHLAAINQNKEV